MMENVDLLKIIRCPSDTKAHGTGAKMLFVNPCTYKVLNADQGTEREAYTVHYSSRAGYEVNAMKDGRKSDYVIARDHVSQTLEVGGKDKNPKGAGYVLGDNTDHPAGNAIPFQPMGVM